MSTSTGGVTPRNVAGVWASNLSDFNDGRGTEWARDFALIGRWAYGGTVDVEALTAAMRRMVEWLEPSQPTQPAPHTPPETRSRAGDAEEDDRE